MKREFKVGEMVAAYLMINGEEFRVTGKITETFGKTLRLETSDKYLYHVNNHWCVRLKPRPKRRVVSAEDIVQAYMRSLATRTVEETAASALLRELHLD